MATVEDVKVEVTEEPGRTPENNTEPEEIKVKWTKKSFQAFGQIMRLRSDDLSREIYARYSKVLHDLKGVNIVCTGGNNFRVEMWFEYNPNPIPTGSYRAIENIVDKKITGGSVNLLTQMNVLQNRVNANVFALTSATRKILTECIWGGDKNAKNEAFWKNNTVEVKMPGMPIYGGYYPQMMAPRSERIMIGFLGMDLRKILRKLFGDEMIQTMKPTRDADGSEAYNVVTTKCMYEARFIKMVPSNAQAAFYMNIEQFDPEAVEKFTIDENPIINTSVNSVIYYNV